MDLTAHAVAERRVDHAMAGQRQLAAEGFRYDGGFEVDPVVSAHFGAGARQALFDQMADGVGVQFGLFRRCGGTVRASQGTLRIK
jgi:hypothetical protein